VADPPHPSLSTGSNDPVAPVPRRVPDDQHRMGRARLISATAGQRSPPAAPGRCPCACPMPHRM
jgi:hypothetical protein